MTAGASTSAGPGKRILVLGGCGFMGSHISRALLGLGHSVRVFDKLYASRDLIADIEDRVEMVTGDIARPHDVLNAIGDAEVVIHLVHTTVPGSSMDDPAYDVTSNVTASVRWLSQLEDSRVRRLLYVSSGGTVYGVPRTDPITESHPTNPICSYGITKLAIEKYSALYSSMRGMKCIVLRPSNVYGEGQRLTIGQGVIGVLADRALRGEVLEIWGTGQASRDFLFIDDMVAATVALLGYEGGEAVFNVSSGTGHSVNSVIRILGEQLGFAPCVVHKPSRSFDALHNVLDSSLLRAATGWRPKVSLEEGIARTLQWLRTARRPAPAPVT